MDINMEQAILDAAEKLFLEKGYALTSTTAIARMAGCNQALVHYYFRTKDRLFEALFEKKFRMILTGIINAGEDCETFEGKLKSKIEAHYDYLAANPKIPFLFFNELTTNPARLESLKEKIKELPKSVIRQFDRDLKDEISRGAIRNITGFDLILTIISLNVVLFMVGPVIKTMIEMPDREFRKIMENRKNENVEIILRSLKA